MSAGGLWRTAANETAIETTVWAEDHTPLISLAYRASNAWSRQAQWAKVARSDARLLAEIEKIYPRLVRRCRRSQGSAGTAVTSLVAR